MAAQRDLDLALRTWERTDWDPRERRRGARRRRAWRGEDAAAAAVGRVTYLTFLHAWV